MLPMLAIPAAVGWAAIRHPTARAATLAALADEAQQEGAIDLGPYANVKAWMGRIEQLPGFKKYEDVLPKQDAA